ncbi:hypothetical protein AMS68_000611 [Peltaster fructicola]|uniref:BRCT domain-containing protein n=1 Tax=Peltaster fructicola TaxID=286661 RepID=A0A6H0XK42_9PEZI|nr:hypothetical protein AMS68_000611 [Peltaster fructicola]
MQDVRNKLADYAIEMGATHMLDLTADVTHLIIGDVRTPKYRYVARARPDVKVLRPEWVEAVRNQWLSGDDVDTAAFEQEYKCPTLSGLHICVTGFQSSEERTMLEETVTQLGATYSGDLTKQVTQLIVAKPEGAKYTHAKQWGIPCVSSKWLVDSIARTMALDETFYDPLLPEDDQGKGAFRLDEPRAVIGKRRRDESQQADDIGKRKLRRTASTRLEGHSQDLWQDISAMGNVKEAAAANQWQDNVEQVRRKSSTTPVSDRPAVQPGAPQLFTGWRMCLQGFDDTQRQKLHRVLQEKCGAEVVENASMLRHGEAVSHCILVPHRPPQSLYYLSRTAADTVIATEWWVERCFHARKIIDPAEDVLSKPLWSADLPNLAGTCISSTGFNSIDLRQVAEVVTTVGAVYQELLEPTTTVLISNSSIVKKEKAFYANKHNIPVVTPDWLWSTIRSKRKQQFEPFKVALSAQGSRESSRLSGQHHRSLSDGHIRPLQARAGTGTETKQPQLPRAPLTRAPAPKIGPFVHEDNEHRLSLDKGAAQPLSERSPNVSSPKKRSPFKDKPQAKTFDKPTLDILPRLDAQDRPRQCQENIRSPEELNADIASLSYKLLESRSGPIEGDNLRRKKRTLGRAASAISNRSISKSAEHSMEDRFDLWDEHVAQEEVTAAPSTQLGYEVPEAEAHRLQMAKRMGTSFADEHGGTKLASIGTVRDLQGRTRSRRQKAIS